MRHWEGNVKLRKLYPKILTSFFQNAGGGATTARFHYRNTPRCYSLCLKENSLRSNDVNYRNGGGGGAQIAAHLTCTTGNTSEIEVNYQLSTTRSSGRKVHFREISVINGLF